MIFLSLFSANEDNDECNLKSELNLSANIPPTENFRNLQISNSTRIFSPDSGLIPSRDDDVGSSLSSASTDEMNKLYEQVGVCYLVSSPSTLLRSAYADKRTTAT